jgi:hypothetical protein
MKRLGPLLIAFILLACPTLAGPTSTTDVPAVVRAMKTRFGVVDLTGTGGASVQGLSGLVALQQTSWPQAVVTSGFYDWRTVSRYRRNAGLHLGYDVAMPAGIPVRAGWPGAVVSVAPWTDTEWGVTVQTGSGLEVTYGHIHPTVAVGDTLAVGGVVGTIAYDHVDVKMRDAAGNYVDFGAGTAAPSTPFDGFAANSREAQMVTWLVARNSLETAESELEGRRRERATATLERQRMEARLAELKQAVPLMARYVEEGLVARVEAEQTRADLETTRQRLADLKRRQKEGPSRLAALEKQVQAGRQRLATVERRARQRGITWAEVTGFVNGVVAGDARLREQVVDFKRTSQQTRSQRTADLRQQVRQGRQQLQELEALYQMGGLPRRDLDAARHKQKLLEAELKALGG